MRFNCVECGRWFDEDQLAVEYDGFEICKSCNQVASIEDELIEEAFEGGVRMRKEMSLKERLKRTPLVRAGWLLLFGKTPMVSLTEGELRRLQPDVIPLHKVFYRRNRWVDR